MNLEDAKEWLRERVGKGARCPCCTQLAKVYKRKIHSGMARALIELYRQEDWVHLRDIARKLGLTSAGDIAKLTYWDLIEPKPEDSGYWRITPKGRSFVKGEYQPKLAVIYDSRFLGHEGEMVSVRDCLGSKFDYDELMSS